MERKNIFGVYLKNQSHLVNHHCLFNMKIDLSDKQLSDIQYAICIAMAHTEKNSNLPKLMKIKPSSKGYKRDR